MNPQIDALKLVPRCPYDGSADQNLCNLPPYSQPESMEEDVPLPEASDTHLTAIRYPSDNQLCRNRSHLTCLQPQDPIIAEINSAAGTFFGFAASPTMFRCCQILHVHNV